MQRATFIVVLMSIAMLTPTKADAQSTPWEWMMDYAQFGLEVKSAEVLNELPSDLQPAGGRGVFNVKYKKKVSKLVLVTIEGVSFDQVKQFLFADPVFYAVIFPSERLGSPKIEPALAVAVKYPPELEPGMPRKWFVPETTTYTSSAQLPIVGTLTFQALFLLPKEVNRFYIKCPTFVKGEAVIQPGVSSPSK